MVEFPKAETECYPLKIWKSFHLIDVLKFSSHWYPKWDTADLVFPSHSKEHHSEENVALHIFLQGSYFQKHLSPFHSNQYTLEWMKMAHHLILNMWWWSKKILTKQNTLSMWSTPTYCLYNKLLIRKDIFTINIRYQSMSW